jgi:hypothetical protein
MFIEFQTHPAGVVVVVVLNTDQISSVVDDSSKASVTIHCAGGEKYEIARDRYVQLRQELSIKQLQR